MRACGRGDIGDGSDSDLAGRNREVRFTTGRQTSMIAGSKSVSCQLRTHAPQQTTKIIRSLRRRRRTENADCDLAELARVKT